ncbi:MAG: hypothetical protein AB7P18_08430 [Candidatus Binatia bacterium]
METPEVTRVIPQGGERFESLAHHLSGRLVVSACQKNVQQFRAKTPYSHHWIIGTPMRAQVSWKGTEHISIACGISFALFVCCQLPPFS